MEEGKNSVIKIFSETSNYNDIQSIYEDIENSKFIFYDEKVGKNNSLEKAIENLKNYLNKVNILN